MRKLFLSALVVLGLTATSCDKETRWEQNQDERITALENNIDDLQGQIDFIKEQLSLEAQNLYALINRVSESTSNDILILHTRITNVIQILESADADNLVIALQAVADVENELASVIENNIEEIKASLAELGVANDDLTIRIDNILTSIDQLQADLDAEVVDLERALADANSLIAAANVAIADNTAAILALTPTTFSYDQATGVLTIVYGNGESFSTGDLRGADGRDGTDGTDGVDGVDGAQGIQGIQGAVGAIGPQGPVGPAGSRGATGTTGAIGPQGQNGATPVMTVNGTATASGTTIVISIDGVEAYSFFVSNGADGADGMDGTTTVAPPAPPAVTNPTIYYNAAGNPALSVAVPMQSYTITAFDSSGLEITSYTSTSTSLALNLRPEHAGSTITYTVVDNVTGGVFNGTMAVPAPGGLVLPNGWRYLNNNGGWRFANGNNGYRIVVENSSQGFLRGPAPRYDTILQINDGVSNQDVFDRLLARYTTETAPSTPSPMTSSSTPTQSGVNNIVSASGSGITHLNYAPGELTVNLDSSAGLRSIRLTSAAGDNIYAQNIAGRDSHRFTGLAADIGAGGTMVTVTVYNNTLGRPEHIVGQIVLN